MCMLREWKGMREGGREGGRVREGKGESEEERERKRTRERERGGGRDNIYPELFQYYSAMIPKGHAPSTASQSASLRAVTTAQHPGEFHTVIGQSPSPGKTAATPLAPSYTARSCRRRGRGVTRTTARLRLRRRLRRRLCRRPIVPAATNGRRAESQSAGSTS